MQIKWEAISNKEKQAVKKFGDVWLLVVNARKLNGKLLIVSKQGTDMRWITNAQVMERIE